MWFFTRLMQMLGNRAFFHAEMRQLPVIIIHPTMNGVHGLLVICKHETITRKERIQ